MENNEALNNQNIINIEIEEEMRRSYMSYAMSVIIGRALPDVRDGLKPVHRRILYAMNEMGNTYNRAYKKSARVVGDVMGKFHPHGDAAIYDTIVRMAQNFSMRKLLIDGQGNFGSVDGDSPAAMRYTEVRMARISDELLRDIDKETVEFVPNYDGSDKEPNVLPTRIPNLLVNGSSGIAVGMATNIPPHNLGEIIDGIILLIDRPEAELEELLEKIKGPDFPTAGFIYGSGGIRTAYETGKGSIILRSRTSIEEENGRSRIIVNELPYQVNKARLIERIADLVRNKEIDGISDLRDESDKDGIRVVIELKRDAFPEVVLNNLYKSTMLQVFYGINMVALVNGKPEQLCLKNILVNFIEHRRDVITKRTIYNLKKAEERQHVLHGLKIAIDNIDRIIEIIRKSRNPEEANLTLKAAFQLSDIQAKAILEMRLQRLTGLEREKLEKELGELEKDIEYFRNILADNELLMTIVKEELDEVRVKFDDPRKTEIIMSVDGDIDYEECIEDSEMIITLTVNGYIKRMNESEYRTQRRGGKGKIGLTTREEDFVKNIFWGTNKSTLLLFSNRGKAYQLKVYNIPEATNRSAKGKPLINLLPIEENERITAIHIVRAYEENASLIFATKQGILKKTEIMSFQKIRKNGIIAINLDENDELLAVKEVKGDEMVILSTAMGRSVCFEHKDLRLMGRTARGVIGIRFRPGDHIVSIDVAEKDSMLLSATENGYGKKTLLSEYTVIRRGGMGTITIKTDQRNGKVVGVISVKENDQLIIITTYGKIIRLKTNELPTIGRNTKGVRLVNLENGEHIQDIERIIDTDDPSDRENGVLENENGKAPQNDKNDQTT